MTEAKVVATTGPGREEIVLPTWTDPGSVISFLTAAVTEICSVVALLHPGFTEPAVVNALVPIVGQLVALGAVALAVWRHTSIRDTVLSR